MKRNFKLTMALAVGLCFCLTQCKKTANLSGSNNLSPKLKTSTITSTPNVLFIIVDDMRYWAVNRLWEDDVARKNDNTPPYTPNIDTLIDESVTFTNAHSAGVECCPSRTAFLSGQYPYQSGVYNNKDAWQTAVNVNSTLFHKFVASSSYQAYAAGKVFHCDPTSYYAGSAAAYFPTSQGYNGGQTISQENNAPYSGYDFHVIETNFLDDREGGTDHSTANLTEDAKAVNACIADMEATKNYNATHTGAQKSFFVACGIRRPHADLWVPRYYFDKFAGITKTPQVVPSSLTGLPQMAQDLAADHQPDTSSDKMIASHSTTWNQYLRAYMGCVSYTDYQVGRLMRYLRSSGMNSNTIVVLVSDHGFHLGEKHRTRKSTLWEETTRVPMIWRVPGVNPGTKCRAAVDLMSLYPTLQAYCGVGSGTTPSGVNIQSLINSPTASGASHYALTFTADQKGTAGATRLMASVRNGDHRLSQYNQDTTQEEVYDHSLDPWEGNDLPSKPWSITLRGQLPSSFIPEVEVGVDCE